MIEDVLLPTDGSDCARTATAHAAAIADAYDATVHVLTVVEAVADDVTESQRDIARTERVEPTLADLEAAGVDVTDAVVEGIPVDAILAAAEERDVDLLALGTHGRSGLRRQLLGSVTERVLRQSPVPVLTVPEAAGGGGEPGSAVAAYENVLLPTDGSEGAGAAHPLGLDLASTFEAALHALSVVDIRPLGSAVQGTALVEEFEETAGNAVGELADAASTAGLAAVETAVVRGTPHEAIERYAADNDVDVVVMGTHGRTGLDRFLLGSVTENLLRTTDRPVLAVRAPAGGEEEEEKEE